jgi:hypothetical protein
MEFRTIINIEPSGIKIDYQKPVMFIGSCFASEIGMKLGEGLMPVMINPSGTVYNPVSVLNTLESIINNREYRRTDLYEYNGKYISFYHYTDFSSDDPECILDKINMKIKLAFEFISRAEFLFITFGTAHIYRLKKTGDIVSNCHKIPSDFFVQELLSVEEIVTLWIKMLDNLHLLFPRLKVVFTISPIRHWKNGAHGNQVSKSLLFIAIEKLLSNPAVIGYFPAYELLMDDLRDYRFYDYDMLHPSERAVEYIWESFTKCYFEKKTTDLWKEVRKITKASSHRIMSATSSEIELFARKILSQIVTLQKKAPFIDFSDQIKYFNGLSGRGDKSFPELE